MTEVTQAERDYVAGMEREIAVNSRRAMWMESGQLDPEVRAIIDYIRNNPLPEQGK